MKYLMKKFVKTCFLGSLICCPAGLFCEHESFALNDFPVGSLGDAGLSLAGDLAVEGNNQPAGAFLKIAGALAGAGIGPGSENKVYVNGVDANQTEHRFITSEKKKVMNVALAARILSYLSLLTKPDVEEPDAFGKNSLKCTILRGIGLLSEWYAKGQEGNFSDDVNKVKNRWAAAKVIGNVANLIADGVTGNPFSTTLSTAARLADSYAAVSSVDPNWYQNLFFEKKEEYSLWEKLEGEETDEPCDVCGKSHAVIRCKKLSCSHIVCSSCVYSFAGGEQGDVCPCPVCRSESIERELTAESQNSGNDFDVESLFQQNQATVAPQNNLLAPVQNVAPTNVVNNSLKECFLCGYKKNPVEFLKCRRCGEKACKVCVQKWARGTKCEPHSDPLMAEKEYKVGGVCPYCRNKIKINLRKRTF